MAAVASLDGIDSSGNRKPSKWLRKTKMCNYHVQGACTFGADCLFAHSADELHNIPNLHKTQMCPDFANGSCNNVNCNFAHGEEELKPFPALKQKLCKWHQKGKCNNGDSCCFAHGRQDLRSRGTRSTERPAKTAAAAAAIVSSLANAVTTGDGQAPLPQPTAWQPQEGSQCPQLDFFAGGPLQTTWQELMTQSQVQLQESQINEVLTQLVGQQSLRNAKQTFEYKADPNPESKKDNGQPKELIFSWRRTPLRNKGLIFVPSSGLTYPSESVEDDMSTCAETAGYLSD